MNEDVLIFVETIEELRKSRGLSQKEMVQNIINASSYARIKNGQADFPLRILFPLSRKLSARIEDILDLYYAKLDADKLELIERYRLVTNDHNIQEAVLLYNDLLKLEPTVNIMRYKFLLQKYFSGETPDIPPLDKPALNNLIEKTLVTKYFTSYDLQFIADFTTVLTQDQLFLMTDRLLEIDLALLLSNNHHFKKYYPAVVGNLADYYMDIRMFNESSLVLTKLHQIADVIDSMELKIWGNYLSKVLIIYQTTDQEIKNTLVMELGQTIEKWLTHLPTSGMTTGLQKSYNRLLSRKGEPPTDVDAPPIYILKP